jgi:hypothetical protein
LTKSANVHDTHTESGDLIKLLHDARWVLDRIRGSHHVVRHPERPGISDGRAASEKAISGNA